MNLQLRTLRRREKNSCLNQDNFDDYFFGKEIPALESIQSMKTGQNAGSISNGNRIERISLVILYGECNHEKNTSMKHQRSK